MTKKNRKNIRNQQRASTNKDYNVNSQSSRSGDVLNLNNDIPGNNVNMGAKNQEIQELKDELRSLRDERKKISDEINQLKQSKEKLEKDVRDSEARVNQEKELISVYHDEERKKCDKEIKNKREEFEAKIQSEEEKVMAQMALRQREEIEKCKKIFESHYEQLSKTLTEINEREIELKERELKLAVQRNNHELEKQEYDSIKRFDEQKRELYKKANPSRLAELEDDLEAVKDSYNSLLEKYKLINSKHKKIETELDAFCFEYKGQGFGGNSSLKAVIDELHKFQDRCKTIESNYEKYPGDESIRDLEGKAERLKQVEEKLRIVEQDRDSYKFRIQNFTNVNNELLFAKYSLEATNQLNKSLLDELQSHKKALESRTGDTCPSLTKVDTEVEEDAFKLDINRRKNRSGIKSLNELVQHIKNYAGQNKDSERLFYSENDIRAFLAGMAVSRLIVLQGMSGTGKSSLPRIISEAISGFNRLIPVESSWRDRNELLGYYNDFNKKFNAKSFTIELYRSTLEQCNEIPTFIVLDEMNLARIEYYFSDFLAILEEPNPENWLIELVSTDMRTLPIQLDKEFEEKMKREDVTVYNVWSNIQNIKNGAVQSEDSEEMKECLVKYLEINHKLTGAKNLVGGRKVRVSKNIWFIGTANHDESTFEISDKVYDRSQVISLNKKGINEGNYTQVNKKYVSADTLQNMFNTAVQNFEGTKGEDVRKKLEIIDQTMMKNFDVSFGNRIVKQTLDFVAVFCAAGGDVTTALDYQISTKILRKVIHSDDLGAMLNILDVAKQYPETKRLVEKRIKELEN